MAWPAEASLGTIVPLAEEGTTLQEDKEYITGVSGEGGPRVRGR
jgi:hypothetical protein